MNTGERKAEAQLEFESIITGYILPLFDTRGQFHTEPGPFENADLICIEENSPKQSTAFFYPRIGNRGVPSPFRCKIGVRTSPALKKPAASILRELLKVTEYDYDVNFRVKRHYGNSNVRQTSYKARTLDLAFELGMCQWLTPVIKDALTLHTIICRMVEWSSRTYEGKNVPFGIVIDFDNYEHSNSANYLHFLENDSSAVFTDGIFTGILLNKEGKVVSFLTKDTAPPSAGPSVELFVPYQFSNIAKHCTNNSIGIIALTNGEIMLIKNQTLCFAKRGRKWVYFDWPRVLQTLREYFLSELQDIIEREISTSIESVASEEEKKFIAKAIQKKYEDLSRQKIRAIYCTLLDVSFAHTGGCLAIVLAKNKDKIGDVVKDRIDLFASGTRPKGISEESAEKIEVLTYLLRDSNNTIRSFFDVEQQLRREILGLDGATVVAIDGSFYCAGSIVAVPGGSSGGGRTAATKNLAKYGVGIKISEDGYIEAYGVPLELERKQLADDGVQTPPAQNGTQDKKPRIIPLFKFS